MKKFKNGCNVFYFISKKPHDLNHHLHLVVGEKCYEFIIAVSNFWISMKWSNVYQLYAVNFNFITNKNTIFFWSKHLWIHLFKSGEQNRQMKINTRHRRETSTGNTKFDEYQILKLFTYGGMSTNSCIMLEIIRFQIHFLWTFHSLKIREQLKYRKRHCFCLFQPYPIY